MIPTTVSSSTSTATISGATGNKHSTSNNGQVNMSLSTTPTANTVSSTATTPPAAQTPSVLLGLASLILEGRALADDEFRPQHIRTTAPAGDISGLSGSGSGHGGGIGSGNGNSVGSHLHSYNTSGLLANTSYGISGSGGGGGRQSPTSRPSTSRAAAGFGGVVGSGPVINITTNPYAFNNSGVGAVHARNASPLYIDPYSANSSASASSAAESTHQRWTQKLCQLRQVSPAANLSTTYEQPVAVEAREPEIVALAINESGANERGDFEIVRRGLLNRTNSNAISSTTSTTPTAGSSAGAGSASSSPGSGSDNFLLSLQSLASTCLRSGSPSIEPNHSGVSPNSAASTPNNYHFKTLPSPPPPQSMYIYRATTPTASASAAAHRFLEQSGSGSSCGSGVQSPRPHWPTAVDNLHTKERYARHASAIAGTGFGSGRMPIPGTAVNTTTASVAVAAAATMNHTTKVTPTTAATATATASKHPQQGPHCDQFLRKMGLAKGEAAEAEDHFCDMSYVNITCSRWRAYCHKIEAIIGRGEPVCIEVYLGPVNHKILLEQWIINQKEKVPPPTMTLPSLCSAIRSQLYFSQICAWCDMIKKSDKTIYDSGRIIFHKPTGAAGDLATPVGSANAGSNITPGSSPNSHTLNNQLNNALSVNRRPRLNIFYRIKSFDSTACFNSKPNVHNFPNVNISENCSISVCLKSLPRINGGIPKIGTLTLSSTPGTTMSTPTTTTAATTATATTMLATATTKANANKSKTTKATAPATTATPGGGMSNSTTRVAAVANATQWHATPNGSSNMSGSEAAAFRNGNSCAGAKPEETPRSSRPSRCVIAAASAAAAAAATATPTAATSTANINLHANSSCSSSMNNSAGVANGASCVDGSTKHSNGCGDTQDSNMPCSRANCAPKHKCVFFIDEDELLPVDEADAEAYGEEDENASDAANSTGDSVTNASAFCAGANMSHREKQLMKYRKRMLKRDKKHHQHHPRKPLTPNTDATCAPQRAQRERDEASCCQPMEEGDEDDAAGNCSGDTMSTLLTRTSARIEMISTGTQTPMSCCRQCGGEKTLVCMRCNSGDMHDEQAIDEPTEADVDDMDDSAASSLSSSDIIHTPRNKAELLLQAIQRTPKVAAAKHKKEQPRKLCAGKAQNNNHLGGAASTHVNVGGKSSGSSLHESALAGCQVCKRQKTQHNFGIGNGEAAATANANEHLADEADNTDIGDADADADADADDDGGKQLANGKFVAESGDKSQLPVTPLTALPTRTQVMEEESFMSSTKLTPQIDRCTLANASNAVHYPLSTSGDLAGGDQKAEDCERSENRTPPAITTSMDGERFDESQFKTPTTVAAGGVHYENSPQLQGQQGVHKAFQHKQTPKPNLLQLHCNYQSDANAGSNQAVGAAGDGFAVVRAKNNELPTALKPHKQPQPHGVHNALLLRKGLPKVNLTPIFCNPMPSPTGASLTSSHSSPIPIHGAANDTTFCFEPTMLHRSSNHLQLQHQLMHSSSGNVCASPLATEVNNIPVQKSYSAPTLPNSPSLSPRFAKQAAFYKRRSRHLSDRSDRSSLGSDEQFSDEDLESAGMYSPATSPLKQSARVAAAFGRLPLLGNLEESLLQKRLVPKVEVMGFTVLLGASGGFCPTQLTIPAASYFYELRGESLSTPYVCEIRLPRKGYSVPRAGNVQATLLNPMGTVVRMFVIPYDMRDMPPLHQTFIRQRILAEASTHEATTQNVQSSTTKMEQQSDAAMAYTNGYGGSGRGAGGDDNLRINNNNGESHQNNTKSNNGSANNNAKNKYRLSPSGGLHGESNLGHFISAENMKRLRYSIHLRFQTSRSGRLSLHTDIRLLISRRTDCDTAAAHAKGVLEAPNDLVTDTVMPTNPKYSARQDQGTSTNTSSSNSGGSGSGSGSGGSNGSNPNVIATANGTAITTNNSNGGGSNKI